MLAFSWPVLGRINEWLAMVWFVSALAVEAACGDGVLAQDCNSAGLVWFAYTVVPPSPSFLSSRLL